MTLETCKSILSHCSMRIGFVLSTPLRAGGKESGTIYAKNDGCSIHLKEGFLVFMPVAAPKVGLSQKTIFCLPYEQIAYIIDEAYPAV